MESRQQCLCISLQLKTITVDVYILCPRVIPSFLNATGTSIVAGLIKVKNRTLAPICWQGCSLGSQSQLSEANLGGHSNVQSQIWVANCFYFTRALCHPQVRCTSRPLSSAFHCMDLKRESVMRRACPSVFLFMALISPRVTITQTLAGLAPSHFYCSHQYCHSKCLSS